MKPVDFGTMSSFYISFPYVLIELGVHQVFLLNYSFGFFYGQIISDCCRFT